MGNLGRGQKICPKAPVSNVHSRLPLRCNSVISDIQVSIGPEPRSRVRTHNRRIAADLRAESFVIVPPLPYFQIMLSARFRLGFE
ncbi:hypothetical protein PoB_001440300 [Plakobranchus ocellatus]|uniref:Uncharacterized protein n=1 Tax=Plakobranchus ocellatus TaxID=259542 RepID=A0AAV3YZV2_9GAST|nr:hypothetical protein PoB_001440300 [Plakobranchus ocellatus]